MEESWQHGNDIEIAVRSPIHLLSENMRPSHWLAIASAARSLVDIESVTGIVVLHGTDTAAYSAAALSFLLSDLPVPVVLTGANLPPNQAGSDAFKNIHDAIIALMHLKTGTYISFAGGPHLPSYVHRGTDVRKVQASGQAFYSINTAPVATITDDTFTTSTTYTHTPTIPLPPLISEQTAYVKVYPGLNYEAVSSGLLGTKMRGVVLELYASGTGPDIEGPHSLPAFISSCHQHGIVVVATVPAAPTVPTNSYVSAAALLQEGALFWWNLLPEVAIVKLTLALGASADPSEVSAIMMKPIVNEF